MGLKQVWKVALAVLAFAPRAEARPADQDLERALEIFDHASCEGSLLPEFDIGALEALRPSGEEAVNSYFLQIPVLEAESAEAPVLLVEQPLSGGVRISYAKPVSPHDPAPNSLSAKHFREKVDLAVRNAVTEVSFELFDGLLENSHRGITRTNSRSRKNGVPPVYTIMGGVLLDPRHVDRELFEQLLRSFLQQGTEIGRYLHEDLQLRLQAQGLLAG